MRADDEAACVTRASRARPEARVIPAGYILSTVIHHSTEVKSCLTATRFEGHYTPDVRVERGGGLTIKILTYGDPEYRDSF